MFVNVFDNVLFEQTLNYDAISKIHKASTRNAQNTGSWSYERRRLYPFFFYFTQSFTI